jgi:hypothetical protein
MLAAGNRLRQMPQPGAGLIGIQEAESTHGFLQVKRSYLILIELRTWRIEQIKICAEAVPSEVARHTGLRSTPADAPEQSKLPHITPYFDYIPPFAHDPPTCLPSSGPQTTARLDKAILFSVCLHATLHRT